MKIRYKLINSNGKVLFNALTKEEVSAIERLHVSSQQIKIGGKFVRIGVSSDSCGTVFGLSSDDDYVKSSKKFQFALQALSCTLVAVEEIVNETRAQINTNTSRLLHNLVTLNAHNIQEIYSIIPQDVLTKTPAAKQVQVVQNTVKSEPKDTAIALLRIAKNNAAVKAEFSVFNKIFDSNPRLERKNHNIHKVLMNILYLFFPDFTDKHVLVGVSCPENTIAYFDYESIHVALYHLVENSVKYVKPYTGLSIEIFRDNDKVTLEFDMNSLAIYEHEIDSIFDDGYSGDLSKKTGKAGSGIGLSRVKDILAINNSKISVSIDEATRQEQDNAHYQRNIFRIELPTSL